MGRAIKKGSIFLAAVILLCNLAIAADVGYILKKERAAKSEILDVFSEFNLSVDLIEDEDVLTYDLEDYRLVFVDDGILRKTKRLPIYNYNSVIMNGNYGELWGLTDGDGISQLASNDPLNVKVENSVLQVYTTARPNGIALHYYFLDDLNKANVTSVARTFTGNTFDFGDVIAVVSQGTRLRNGRTAGGKMCFYGIAKSPYWTSNARNLFMDCVENVLNICETDADCDDSDLYTEDICVNPGTVNSYCDHLPIECLDQSDCGTNKSMGDLFCDDPEGDLFQDFVSFTCNDPGTSGSFCSNQTDPLLIQDCGNEELINNYCVGDDVYGNYSIPVCAEQSGDDECSVVYEERFNQTCDFGCSNGVCEGAQILCDENSDCGVSDWVGDLYCDGNDGDDIWRDWQQWTCMNPNTTASSCDLQITPMLFQECADTCINGSCIGIVCYTDADCDDSNPDTVDYCNNPGTVDSFCSHEGILCASNSDCGTNRFIDGLYCQGNSIYRDFLSFMCNNPNQENSFCSNTIDPELLFVCQYACANGFCVRCNDIEDCDDQDETTEDICWFSGTVDSYCSHEHIECEEDIECGINSFIGVSYCDGDDLYQDYRTFMCINEGTPGSFCNSDISSQLIEECFYGCDNGRCITPPSCNCDSWQDQNCGQGSCSSTQRLQTRDCDPSGCDIEQRCVQDPSCDQPVIKCYEDSGCGIDKWVGDEFCDNDDLWREYLEFTCHNPGTTSSYCSNDTDLRLIEECDDLCVDDECIDIDCYMNEDCGPRRLLNNYCVGDNLWSNYSVPTCLNPSTIDSECITLYEQTFNETCEFECRNGFCVDEEIHDVAIDQSLSDSVGGIRLKHMDGTIISDEVLSCNEKYKIIVKILNLGDFAEDVIFDGEIDGLSFAHNPKNNFMPGSSSLKTKTVNFTLSSSRTYNIDVEAIIPADDNPANNFAQREIEVDCGPPSCNCDSWQDQNCGQGSCSSTQRLQTRDCDPSGCDIEQRCVDDPSCGDIYCDTDDNCGDDGFTGDEFCDGLFGDEVWQNYTDFTCHNAGTIDSFCSNETYPLLIEECADRCVDGACVDIFCELNSQCGTNRWIGDEFCQNNDVWRNYKTFTCNNPGQSSSFCSNQTDPLFLEECFEDYCDNWQDWYCLDDDTRKRTRDCYDLGCLNGNCFNNSNSESQQENCPQGELCIGGSCTDVDCTTNADCDDRLFCNGEETCNLQTNTCVSGTPPELRDGVGCTNDYCDEKNDVIVHDPDDSLCLSDTVCADNYCDVNLDCQVDYEPSTTVCRAQNGICDIEETCTGTSADCPSDQVQEDTFICRNPVDAECDITEYCDGANKQCPGDEVQPRGTLCGLLRHTDNFCGGYNNYFAHIFADSHDSCDGAGDCSIIGEAKQVDKYCSDNSHSDGINSLLCNAVCDENEDCPDSFCSETFNDYCKGLMLVEYDDDKILDSTTVTNSAENECLLETSCECENNSVSCEIPETNEYCVEDVCDAECDSNDDCDVTMCDYLDKCIGHDYYNYNNMTNDCKESCDCEENACTDYDVSYNDLRCNNVPQNLVVLPTSGSSCPGKEIVFATGYRDLDGYRDIKYAQFMISQELSNTNNVFVSYNQNTNRVWIRNDAGEWIGNVAPGTPVILNNSYFSLNVASVTTTTNADNDLIVFWPIKFKTGFTGHKNTWLYVKDDADATDGWEQIGTYDIEIKPKAIFVVDHDDDTGYDATCPAPYEQKGRIHVGRWNKDNYGKDYFGRKIKTGWLSLCVIDDSARLVNRYVPFPDNACPDGYTRKGGLLLGGGENNWIAQDYQGVPMIGSGWSEMCVKNSADIGESVYVNYGNDCHDDSRSVWQNCPNGYESTGLAHVYGGSCRGSDELYNYKDQFLDSGWIGLCSKSCIQ